MSHVNNKIWINRIKKDEKLSKEILALCKSIKTLAAVELEYFRDLEEDNDARFYKSFVELHDIVNEDLDEGIKQLLGCAHLYDYDPDVPANGYRSYIDVVQRCCTQLLQLVRHIAVAKKSILFRENHYSLELEAYVKMLTQLKQGLYCLQEQIRISSPGELFPDVNECSITLMMDIEKLNQEAFYGRCLAFQYCDSMRMPVYTLALVMTSYSQNYRQNSSVRKFLNLVLDGRKHHSNPEQRAKTIAHATRCYDVGYIKGFWNFLEGRLMQMPTKMWSPSLAINEMINLGTETIQIQNQNTNETLEIVCPDSKPLPCRFISSKYRKGQDHVINKSALTGRHKGGPDSPMCPYLLLHCHGGGFLAQTTVSHEVYLRPWAADLDLPILSVDYSHAPDYPYPRQLQEMFYAYVWALKNSHKLGWTGEKIVFAGDSAGANISMATILKAIESGIRLPDGILSVYGTLLVKYQPSPSRVLSVMDSLLPLGFLAQCLAAYAGVSREYNNDLLYKESEEVQEASKDNTWSVNQRRGSRVLRRSVTMPTDMHSYITAALEPETCNFPHSPMNIFNKLNIPDDPLISPYLAEDEVLKQLPPVSLVACNLDPLLDDTIMFGRRLHSLNNEVVIDVIEGLPHGFLNFSLASKDAKAASDLCVSRIKELFGIALE